MGLLLGLTLPVLALLCSIISAQQPRCSSNNTYAPPHQPHHLVNRNLSLPHAQHPYLIMILMPNNASGLVPLSQTLLENIWGSMASSTVAPSLEPTTRRPRVRTRGRHTSRPTPRPVPLTSTNGHATNRPNSTMDNTGNSTSPHPQSSTVHDPQSSTSPHPQSSTIQDPQNSTSPHPQSSTIQDPQNSTSPHPQSSTIQDPQNSTSPHPQSSTIQDPQNSISPHPQSSTVHDPQSSTSPHPQSSTVHDPQNSTSTNSSTHNNQSPSSPQSNTATTAGSYHPTSTTPNSGNSTSNHQQSSVSSSDQYTDIFSTNRQRSTSPSPTSILPNSSASTTRITQYSTSSADTAAGYQQQSASSSTSRNLLTSSTGPQRSSTNSGMSTTQVLQSSTTDSPQTSSSSDYITDDYTSEDTDELEWEDDCDDEDLYYCDTAEDPSESGDYSSVEVGGSDPSSHEQMTTSQPPSTAAPSSTVALSETSATTQDPRGHVVTPRPNRTTTVAHSRRTTTRRHHHTNAPVRSTPDRHRHAHSNTSSTPAPHNINFWPCLGSAPTDSSYQTVTQMLSNNGYHSEAYLLRTADNYLLCLHRIPHGHNSSRSANRPVVLLQHGIPGSSADWIIAGRSRGLAYLLADAGYDVWMSNLRGNNYSLGHEYLDTHSDRYWSFSLDEMAIFDIPAVLDHILYQTQQSSVYVVTQSTGSATLLATLSSRPCYNHNIRAAYHLAPAVYLSNNTDFLSLQNHPRTGRFNATPELLSQFGIHRCLSHRDAVPEAICRNFRFLVGGYSHCNITRDVLAALINHSFAGTSEKSYLHYSQVLASGMFRQFDYGPLSNLIVYSRTTPPEYDLGLATAPSSIFYSELDPVVGHREVSWLIHELPNVVEVRHVPHFTHWDFLWGPRAREDVYNHILQELQQLNHTWWPETIPPVCEPVAL